ncbi:N-acetylneuraminate synthase family protein [Clostridium botulinum]|uniref:N-acetylneuraminate synthase n=1 Tax=Clostridium botulinum TaxID=1491 RepID=A0A9Q1ZDF6_CLOBO|nr:N-acetylneuraminate synthase family protein [Clostridium botulinum]AEB75790.1 N-acetylneuraminate synthase [Clostridium botulinum BKT015925]KEH98582.1 N-acetylneuraminate synthase [Clostridium botulinum D str. 16868]KEI05754.1 N-acetylneuraminate synthase [Clostridium botulinum C/D str. Sp77]KLU75627.1 N-acetylneuraminate synthase [Clostridium botulinum V891]KOA75300.1 N-acetylneuraminate synthase [Clostridium botulinum]
MKKFQIGKVNVGPKYPVFIIAEVGVNHNGDINLAYKLIDLAVKAGANAVKFQMFYPGLLCSSVHRSEEIEMLNKYVVSFEYMKELRDYTYSLGLEFIVTPFDFKSLEEVIKLECSAIKIGSGELTHIPFLKEVAKSNMPIIVSTGASNLADVERAVKTIKDITTEKFSILHCVSTYPAPIESLNMKAINTLENVFSDCIIGYSDHSLGSTASHIAVALGANIIEKHITLDKGLEGPDHKASASEDEFIYMVRSIREAEKMMGSGYKEPQSCEGIIGRSLVFKNDFKKGHIISQQDIDYKRPGKGIRPYQEEKIIGMHLNKDVKMDELVTLGCFIRKGGECEK